MFDLLTFVKEFNVGTPKHRIYLSAASMLSPTFFDVLTAEGRWLARVSIERQHRGVRCDARPLAGASRAFGEPVGLSVFNADRGRAVFGAIWQAVEAYK